MLIDDCTTQVLWQREPRPGHFVAVVIRQRYCGGTRLWSWHLWEGGTSNRCRTSNSRKGDVARCSYQTRCFTSTATAICMQRGGEPPRYVHCACSKESSGWGCNGRDCSAAEERSVQAAAGPFYRRGWHWCRRSEERVFPTSGHRAAVPGLRFAGVQQIISFTSPKYMLRMDGG